MVARLPEANVDLCRFEEYMRSVTHHEASKTCVGETVEAQPVGVSSGGGRWAYKVSGHAEHLQPSCSCGRLRHHKSSGKLLECVRERVKVA